MTRTEAYELSLKSKTDEELRQISGQWNGDEEGLEEDIAHMADEELERRKNLFAYWTERDRVRGHLGKESFFNHQMAIAEDEERLARIHDRT